MKNNHFIYNSYTIKRVFSFLEHSCAAIHLDFWRLMAKHWTNCFMEFFPLQSQTVYVLLGEGYKSKLGILIADYLEAEGYCVKCSRVFPNNALETMCEDIGDLNKNKGCTNGICIDAISDRNDDERELLMNTALIKKVNTHFIYRVAIDLPSGMHPERGVTDGGDAVFSATTTITLLFPRLSLLFPENEKWVGEWYFVRIKEIEELLPNFNDKIRYVQRDDVKALLPRVSRFAHKGTNGSGLLIAGQYGMMGAAQLAAKAAVHSGMGLLTVHVPKVGVEIMQLAVPEAVLSIDDDMEHFSECQRLNLFSCLAIGPGLGSEVRTGAAILRVLQEFKGVRIVDADALNVLAQQTDYASFVNAKTVLTPHPKEFERLAGKSENSFDRIRNLCNFVDKNHCNVLLKGAYSVYINVDGELWFNLGGSPAMGKGGSGDILSGVLLSLVAQGMTLDDAVITGMAVHAWTGERAEACYGCRGVSALDLIEMLKQVWHVMEQKECI